MKKKHLTNAKKTLSVFLAVLMLMTCWVFVPGEHQIEAEAALAYGMSAVSSFSTGTLTINNNGTLVVTYPQTMYIDKSESLQDAGYYITLTASNLSKQLLLFPVVWGGQEIYGDDNNASGNCDPVNLKGNTTFVDAFDGYGLTKGSGADGWFDSANYDSGRTRLFMCGSPSSYLNGDKYMLNGTPTKTGTFTYSWSSSTANVNSVIQDLDKYQSNRIYISSTSYYTGTVAMSVVVYDKTGLNSVISTANTYLSQTSKYTSDSLNNLRTAVNEANTVLKTREVTEYQINTQIEKVNLAIQNLVVARNFDVTYENLFSLSDWINSDSYNKQTSGTAEILVENDDTIKIYKSATSGEVTTSSSYPSNHSETRYAIPVEGGKEYTVRYNIADNSSVTGIAQSEVFMFWYDVNNAPVTAVGSTNTFNNKGFSSKGTCSVTFTAPASATKAEIRFDNDCPSSGSTLRFTDIAVYPTERATEVELDSWTVRPTKKTFAYGVTLSGKLDVPERKGYKFNGWYIDNVNVNGIKDSGEEVTDANGNVTRTDLTMLQTYNLYADWLPLPMDIGYDNLFSLAEWAKTNSVKPNDANRGTIAYDVMAGTITAESTATGEVYSNYGTGSDQYIIAVEPNTEYIFEADMDLVTGDKGQIFVFFYDANGAGATGAIYNGTAQGNAHIGIYPTTEGTSSIAFTTPANCTKMAIRVGATNVGTKAVYSNIGFYKKDAYDAYAKDYATIRVPFNFGDTTSLSLVPTRAGYKFDGWYTADGIKLTSVSGLKASDTVYAQWIDLFTVTFKNWDGTVLKTQEVVPGAAATAPQDPTRVADSDYEYDFAGWDVAFTNVNSDLTVTATYNSKDHTGISKTYASPADCTSAAKYTQLCTACGYVWNEVFDDVNMPALGHTYERENPSSTVVTGTSTGKTDDDVHTIKCNACDATTTVKHNFIEDANHPATEATCVIAGKIYYKCACLEEKTVEGSTNPNKHVNTVIEGAYPAECEKPGYTGDTYCNDCQKTVATGSEIKALEHKYTNYVYNEGTATCFADGTETATCDLCKAKTDTRTATGSKLTHEYTNYVYNEGTAKCEVNGTETAYCDHGCNTTDTREAANTALTHNYTGTVKDNGDGTHSFLCKNGCGTYGGTVDCLTWTPDGVNCKCTVCGYTKPHAWGDWSQDSGNTGDAAGKHTHTCKDCNAVESPDCVYTFEKTEATCEDNAYTTYTCTTCGHGYTVIDLDSKKGHDFTGEYKYDAGNDKHQQACANGCGNYGVGAEKDAWADCSWTYANKEAGKHIASCVCGNKKEQTCTGGTATCTDKAACQFCNTAYGTTSDHVLTGTEKYLKIATDATCIANETYYKYCIGCEEVFSDETYEKPGTMTAHDYTCTDEYLYKATEAECGVNETYYAYCSNPDCKKSSEDANNTYEKPNTALEHIWVNAQYNGEETLKHTFTCERGCGETMEANCMDSAVSFDSEPATCTSQGYDIVQCTECGHQWNINYTSALGHDYTKKIYADAYLEEAANCEHANIYWYACSRCERSAEEVTEGEVYTGVEENGEIVLNFLSGEVRKHDFQNKVDAKYIAEPATCFAAAKYFTSCKYEHCGKTSEEVYGEGKGTKFSSGTALEHDWTKVENAKYLASEADCVNDATYYYECSLCKNSSKDYGDGATWTKENSKSGHSMTHTEANDATCDAAGNYEYWYCSICKKYFKDTNGDEAYLGQSETVIKKREHDIEKVAYKAATCEKDGHPAYEYCKYEDCDYTTLPEVLPDGYKAAGHNFTGAYYCDSANFYHAQYCINVNCDKVTLTDADNNAYQVNCFGMVVDGEQVKYTVEYDGLDYVIKGGEKCEFEYTAETVDGVHTHALKCKVCNGNGTIRTYTDDETFVETVAPTCTTKGYDSFACPEEDCDATWTKNEVAALDHLPADKATSNGDGTHSVLCTREGCGYKISTEKCSGGTATCKDKAVCEKCNASYGDTTGHTYTADWVYQNDATCGKNGTEKNTCSVCGTEEIREAKNTALDHTVSEYVNKLPEGVAIEGFDASQLKAPTCAEQGFEVRYCTRGCGYYQTRTVAKDKNAHVWETDAEGELVWKDAQGDCGTGITYKNYCTVCDKFQVKTETGEHTWEVTAYIPATCTKTGFKELTCAECGFVEDHYYNEQLHKELGDEYADKDLAIAPEAHTYKYVGIIEATCTEPAKSVEKCVDCGDTVETAVEGSEAKGHDLVYYKGADSDCRIEGTLAHWTCKTCKVMFADEAATQVLTSVVIPRKDHADKDGNGKCDKCNAAVHSDDSSKFCGCICHKENFIMVIIYKIVNFFWKLFKISKTCDCGAVHWQ